MGCVQPLHETARTCDLQQRQMYKAYVIRANAPAAVSEVMCSELQFLKWVMSAMLVDLPIKRELRVSARSGHIGMLGMQAIYQVSSATLQASQLCAQELWKLLRRSALCNVKL